MTVHMTSEPEIVAAALARAAGRYFGGAAIIEKLGQESGGASRQTWSFDACVNGERHGLILRRDPPLLGRPGGERSSSLDRATEFRVIAAAWKAGVRAPEVRVEVHLGGGLPSMNIVGLPEAAVREAKDRVRAAIQCAQFEFPARRITVNLAPADLPKDGGRYNLSCAVIVKRVDAQTRAKVGINELLRDFVD